MWAKLIIVFILFLGCEVSEAHHVFYQDWQIKVDSLKAKIASLPLDTNKINAYLKLSAKLAFNDNNLAIAYADSALLLSKRLNYLAGEALAYTRISAANTIQGNYNAALEKGLIALDLHKSANNIRWVAYDLNILGIINNEQGNYSESIDIYRQLLEGIPQGTLTKTKGLALSNMGLSQFKLGMVDSAFYNYNLALTILEKNNFIRETAFVFDNLADVYILRKEYIRALEILNKAIAINTKGGNNVELGNNYIKQAKVYYALNNLKLAHLFLDKVLFLADSFGLENLKNESYTYLKLTYFKENNLLKAYEFSEKERKLSEKLLTNTRIEQIESLRKVYEFDKVNQSLNLSKQKIKNQQLLLYGFVLGVFLLLAFVFLLLTFFRNKIKSNEALSQLNSEVISQSNKLKEANEKIQGMNKGLESLIRERTDALLVQNEKLMEYAHFNAHEIRGPMARLTGLLHLCKTYPNEIDNDEFLNRVFVAISELSEKVEEISAIFKEEGSVNNKD